MGDQSEDCSNIGSEPGLSRRNFLGAGAAVGGALLMGDLLAACGGGSETSASSAATTSSSKQLGDSLRTILGEPQNLLAKGPGEFDINGMLALSGPSSIYGKLQTEGIEMGIEHVEAWTNGKLKFNFTGLDHKGADPQASVQAARSAGQSGSPLLYSSYSWGFGAAVPLIEQAKILSLDPGGGTGPTLQGVPYCYGTRANWPTDPQDGLTKMILKENPEAENWLLVQPEIAPEYNDAVTKYMEKLYAREGVNFLGTELAPIGQTDYATVIQKVKEKDPDVVVFMTFGPDPAYQAKEVIRQGVDAIFGCNEFTPDAVKLAGSAYKDWYFGFDYINALDPPNDWTKLFVEQFEGQRGEAPGYYQAGFYVTTFIFARLMDAVLGAGDDIMSGDAYVKALSGNPSFPHVYGGEGDVLGELVIDLKTHSPSSIPMIGFQSEGDGSIDGIVPLATYNIGGRDFQLQS